MKEKYLIDSVILIDHLNGIKPATIWLLNNSKNSAISVITRAEILSGVTTKELKNIRMLLNSFTCFPIDIKLADKAAELRRTFRWKLPDAFQAAFAEIYKVKLITRNIKDFDPKKHKFASIPYLI